MANERIIWVYDAFSDAEPALMGWLYVGTMRGGESYAFEYETVWLKAHALSFRMDPALLPYGGRQYPDGKGIFGLFADASPDRRAGRCRRFMM